MEAKNLKAYAETLVQIFNPTGEALAAEFWIKKAGRSSESRSKRGFSPMCRNKFDPSAGCRLGKGGSCRSCPHGEHLPLMAEVFMRHIKGQYAHDRRGVYPMLPGDLTPWVAADLDNHDGTKDPANDLRKIILAARALEIPCSIFNSNSGHGYHLYIFFQSPIPAAKARALILTLLERADVDISHRKDKQGSFDCVFPKQDKLKEGEIGNLIALPYHGKAMRERNATLLMDPDTLEPFEKRWEDNLECFVETLRTLTEKELDELLQEMGVLNAKRREASIAGMGAEGSEALSSRIMKCAFLEHCRVDAATLREPDWYLMICILAREYGGPALIHELSRPHPGYSVEETKAKIDHALMDQPGPVTCRKIKEVYDCGMDCGVSSPLALLRKNRSMTLEMPEGEIKESLSKLLKDAQAGDMEAPFSAVPLLAKLPKHVEAKWYRRFKDSLNHRLNLNLLAGAVKEERNRLRKVAGPQETHTSSLPSVNVDRGQMRELSEKALKALEASNDPPSLFVRGAEIVRLRVDEKGTPLLEGLTESAMRGCLGRSANWFRETREGLVDTPPPLELVRDILSLPRWPFPILDAIIETPTLRPDGSLLSLPGYDAQTRLYYHQPPGFRIPPLPDAPTTEDARKAAQFFLQEVLCDFPFADEASKANVLGFILTVLFRPMIKGKIPLALVDAPQSGTGKTLLSEAISAIVTGRASRMTTAPVNRSGSDKEEWRKMITATLVSGTGLVIIDNVDGVLDSPSLAAALTMDTWCDRVLGKSRQIVLPQRTTWMANGNNLRLGGDLPRRCYWIRLDAEMARPWQRSGFRHNDLIGWVSENRGELVASLLCMARAWFVAGKPSPGIRELGGFECWTRTIGGILESAGVSGFLQNLDELYENCDEASLQWQAFLENWHAAYGDRAIAVNEITNDISSPIDEFIPRERSERIRALRNSLPERLPESFSRSLGSFKVALGKALSRHTGVHFPNMLHLERAKDDSHTKAATWRVVRTCHHESCGGSPPGGKKAKLMDFSIKKVVSAEDAGDGSSLSREETTSSEGRNIEEGKCGVESMGHWKTPPASSAGTPKNQHSQGVIGAGDPQEASRIMIRCSDCSHFDGAWCTAPFSWDGKRGQDANELHPHSDHCNEIGKDRLKSVSQGTLRAS